MDNKLANPLIRSNTPLQRDSDYLPAVRILLPVQDFAVYVGGLRIDAASIQLQSSHNWNLLYNRMANSPSVLKLT